MARERPFETWQVEQLLRLLDQTDCIDWPVCIERRERPDFLLSTRRGLKIGLEVTSFTDEEVMWADHLHHTVCPDKCISITGLRDGASKRSRTQIIEVMFGSEWEATADAVGHVAGKIVESIQVKRGKFHQADFAKFRENWLLITDHLNPFDHGIEFELLTEKLSTVQVRFPEVIGTEFSRIYVLHGPCCFRFCDGKLAAKMDRNHA